MCLLYFGKKTLFLDFYSLLNYVYMHASIDLPVVGYMLYLLLVFLIITLASTNNTGIRHTLLRSETCFGLTFLFPLKHCIKTNHSICFNSDASDRL